MSKSPLNFGLFGGARTALRSGRGRKQLSGRINKLENQMGVVMRDRNKNYDMGVEENDPQFATATESQPGSLQAPIQEDVLTPMNTFSPGTMDVANSMFGSSIPGSFDKDMGMSPLNNKKSSKREDQKEKPLTDKEKKRLHAVSSINYDKVVASGGVDLGIIKNKKKK